MLKLVMDIALPGHRTIVTSCIMLQSGETALHVAALKGHVEVIKMLVKYGAAVDIRNKV